MNILKLFLCRKRQPAMCKTLNNSNNKTFESDKFEDKSYWDASRIIDSITELATVKYDKLIIPIIEDRSNPYWVKIQRIYSVMQAYGKHIAAPIDNKISINPSTLMSATISSDKRRMIEMIFNEFLSCDETSEIIKNQSFYYLFTELFLLYVNLKKIDNPFSRVMECSREVYNQLWSVETMIKVNLVPFEEKIKNLLVLLMGDDYDNPISVETLVRQFAYPAVSDETIRQMEIDW